MIRVPYLAFAALLPLAAACTSSAGAATRSYGVTSFDRIRVAGPFDVQVHVGGAPSVRATGPQEAIDRLSIEQSGTALVVKPLPGGWGGWPMGFHGKLVVEISTPSLNNATLAGSGNVAIDRVKGDQLDLALSGSGNLSVTAIDVTRLAATMTGSGDLSVAGRAVQAKAMLTGSGDLKGDQLATDVADVSLIGSGDLSIGARRTAKVNLAGSGDIRIAGPANCAITRTGSGDVHCAHQSSD
ncbi:MAG TPA: head GIN domain-containing protein [Sphingomonas sp.]|nr:head GIN domain-containing protein [Sphingomonas sp.]